MTLYMAQTKQPLYPKISPIYNKILQLAIAICLIVVLMNLWVFSYGNNQQASQKHFVQLNEQYLGQIVSASMILLSNDKEDIQKYFDQLAQNQWVKDISFYDQTGQLLVATQDQGSINDLFGISINKANRNEQFTTFVHEVRGESLQGYIRLTVENHVLMKNIEQSSYLHYDLVRLMIILAMLVGFFLTRGLNRFSRQGFRLT